VLDEVGHDDRSNLSHVVRGRLLWCIDSRVRTTCDLIYQSICFLSTIF
jgi:hypothetical protein